MVRDIFREYDIRGIFKTELDEKMVSAIGIALGKEMVLRGVKSVSIGYDARLSAKDLFKWLSCGLAKSNVKIIDIGLNPTPVGYFSVFTGKFDANIMITGSHNPKEYNGFKITIGTDSYFGNDLQNLADEVCKLLESNEDYTLKIPDIQQFDISSLYIDYLSAQFAHLKNLSTKIVIDCGNGATGNIVQKIIQELNINAKILYKEPDGNFPNHHPDPSEKENLIDIEKSLKNNESEIGFGFDGDGDRIAVLTQKRNIKGDELAYLYSLAMTNPRVLGEVKCSQNIYDALEKNGSKSFMGKTGHSNIKKAMKELNIDMAAEVSGHIFFKERYFGFDDAIYAMLRVLELIWRGIDLDSELDNLPIVYSTDEIKFKTTEKNKFLIVNEIKNVLLKGLDEFDNICEIIDIDGIRVRFENGWALVRASNTTPIIVMRFEANTLEFKNKLEDFFVNLVKQISLKIEKGA